MLLTARYVVPVDGPPIENGGVVIHEGRIVEVGPAKHLRSRPRNDYGDAVILPGFVNAHTHLELTFLQGQVPPAMGFVPWIRALAAKLISSAASPETIEASVQSGVAQSLAAGVTAVGDITRSPSWVRPVLARSRLRGVSFGEVIGIGAGKDRWPRRLDQASSTESATAALRIGISPHAPYTVEGDGLRACADRAKRIDAPLCIHVAETPDEESFTRRLEGLLVDLLKGADVWEETMRPSGLGPVELCGATGILGPDTLLAHANYVSDTDLALIARSGSNVAYCPRTHTAFGHPPHRFRDMLRAGINVCVGTDSLASSPSLSVLDELRFLRCHHADVTAGQIVSMGTLRGASALGIARVTGSVSVGKSADLAVIPLETTDRGWEMVLEEGGAPIAVFVEGC